MTKSTSPSANAEPWAELGQTKEQFMAYLLTLVALAKIACGSWCHRHLVKLWLEHHLAIEVPEVGAPPDFDPLAFWKTSRIALPWDGK
jgi:hypothetical protein